MLRLLQSWGMARTPRSRTSICAAMPDALGEGREGELELGDLLDAHAGRHAGGDHLDHLGRVLAEHVGADDLSPPGLDDQLAEALRLTVGDGPQQILVAGHGDRAVVAGARLLFGEPDAGVLGIGEAPGRDDLVDDPAARAQHRVLGCHAAFEEGARDQHAVPVDVAGGEDVRDARAKVVVHHHVAALDRHAGRGGVDEVGVAGPAHREEGGVDVHVPRLVAGPVDDAHTRFEWLEPLDARARDDLDAPLAEGLLERGRDVLVRSRHDPRRVLEQRDLAAEVGQDRGELAAGVRRPDDADPVGQGAQAAHVLEGQAQLGTRDRKPRGPPADGDDHPVGTPDAAVHRPRPCWRRGSGRRRPPRRGRRRMARMWSEMRFRSCA